MALKDSNDVHNVTTSVTPPLSLPPIGGNDENKEIINLAVLLPSNSFYKFSLNHVLPAIDLAKEEKLEKIVPSIDFRIRAFDTKCDAQSGPIAAVDLMINRSVDVFLGPVCPYSCAPIGRFARHWGKPVITAGAEADAFANKAEYFVTRTNIVYDKLGKAVAELILDKFHWKHYNVLLFDTPRDIYHQDCSFQTHAVHYEVMRRLHLDPFNDTVEFHSFNDWHGPPYEEIVDLLELTKTQARGM